MSNPYFGASALPVSRNAGRQIADANRYLQQHSQKKQQQARPASIASSSSASSFSSRISGIKQKLNRHSSDSQRQLLKPENINRAQIHIGI